MKNIKTTEPNRGKMPVNIGTNWISETLNRNKGIYIRDNEIKHEQKLIWNAEKRGWVRPKF